MLSRRKKTAAGPAPLFLAAAVVGCALFFVSCYPGEELTVSDLDVVATFFEADANFATKLDYAMPAMIFDVNDSSMQTGPEADASSGRN